MITFCWCSRWGIDTIKTEFSLYFVKLEGIKYQFNLHVAFFIFIVVKAHQYFFVRRLKSVARSQVEVKREFRLPNKLASDYFAHLQKFENYLRILYVLIYLTFIRISTKIPKLSFQSDTTTIIRFSSSSIFEIEIVIDNTWIWIFEKWKKQIKILPSNVTTIGLLSEFLVLRTNTAFGVAGVVVLVVGVVVIDVVVAIVVVIGAVEVETSADVVVS